MKSYMKKILIATALIVASMGTHADIVKVSDAELSDINGGLIPFLPITAFEFINLGGFATFSLVNAGPLSNSGVTALNFFGTSEFAAINVLGVAGVSGINIMAGSLGTVISPPTSLSLVGGITLPFSGNGLGIFNLF